MRDCFDDAALEQRGGAIGSDGHEANHHAALTSGVLARGGVREPAVCTENKTPVAETGMKRAGQRQHTVIRIEEDIRRQEGPRLVRLSDVDPRNSAKPPENSGVPCRMRKPG